MAKFTSTISNKQFPESEKVLGSVISPSILEVIKNDCVHFNDDSCISFSELVQYKQKYLQSYLVKEMSDITQLEKEVIDSISNKSIITEKESDNDNKVSFAQRLSDKVASFGGSWKFIILFGIVLTAWIVFNTVSLFKYRFDPYPFILMNLILSCIAAMQAPIIMMSQNRQEEKDRQRAKQDYMINLKSELEIRLLHEKIDHLIIDQQEELIKYQQQQIDKLDLLLSKQKTSK
jgi:uncharacterized membrane protein